VGNPKRPSLIVVTGVWLGVARARPEVAVLVVAGGDRDVKLARARCERPVGCHDGRRVEPEALGARRALVERRVHVHPKLRSESGGERMGRAAGQLLGFDTDSLRATLLHGEVAAERELLEADERGPASAAIRTPRESASVCSPRSGRQRS
jgi:hypothetical protein